MIEDARDVVTDGAAKALLNELTWDSDTEGLDVVLVRHQEVVARAALMGAMDRLMALERKMWVAAARAQR